MEQKLAIREFVEELLARRGDTQPVSDVSPLLTSGRLQSIDAVQIAMFLEKQFGIDFAKSGFDQEKIDNIDGMLSLAAASARGS